MSDAESERPSSTLAVFSPHFSHLRLFSLSSLAVPCCMLCSENSFCDIKFDITLFPVDPEEESASVLFEDCD